MAVLFPRPESGGALSAGPADRPADSWPGLPPSQPRRRAALALLGGLPTLGALGSIGGCAAPPLAPSESTPLPTAVVPFSAAAVGQPPAGWAPYVMRRDRPMTRYAVVNDDAHDARHRVLHAQSASAASGLRCAVRIDPRQHGRLRFSWRVRQVPGQISVAAPEIDDSPARIILAFDGEPSRLSLRDRLLFDQVELFTGQRLPFATLMYVWDGSLPAESMVHNHRTGRIRYLTVESGPARAGQWLHYERDVVADFQRVFGEAPGLISSVGVLTDSDATKQDLQAWYGDITLG